MRYERIPIYLSAIHFAGAFVILLWGWLVSDSLFPFVILLIVDWPVSLLLYPLSYRLVPVALESNGATSQNTITLAILLLIFGSLWYYFVSVGIVAVLRKKNPILIVKDSFGKSSKT